MKILFLCGSLEPGKDGVGDYTRRLAGELIRQGHQTCIISLNDKHCNTQIENIQESDGTSIEVLRLPSIVLSKERFYQASLFIKKHNPDWLSLQYVPFSFQDKGLPFGLSKQLVKIGKGRKWHIMFHELWVGMNIEAKIKLKAWGQIQKLIIQSFCKRLNPTTINTQTQVYKYQLSKLGIESKILSLFSNIPINHKTANLQLAEHDLNPKIQFIIFGSIHSGAPIEQLTNTLLLISKRTNKEVELVLIGRNGSEKEIWKETFNKKGFQVINYGEQDVSVISQKLLNANYGITTTPYLLTEKSGTVIAMLEHSLTVISLSQKWSVRNFNQKHIINGVIDFSTLKDNIDNFKLNKNIISNSLIKTAQEFTNSLSITQ